MTTRSYVAVFVASIFLLSCTSTKPGTFTMVKCPLDDGYYIGKQRLDPGAMENLVKVAKAHCKKKNKCLLAITEDSIVCREDYSADEVNK